MCGDCEPFKEVLLQNVCVEICFQRPNIFCLRCMHNIQIQWSICCCFFHSVMIPLIVHVSVSDKMSSKQYMHCHPIGPNKLWVDKSRSFYDCAYLMCGTSRRRESSQLRNKRAKHIKPRVFWWYYNWALRCLISPTISFFVPKPNQTTSTNIITTVHCWPSVPVIPK